MEDRQIVALYWERNERAVDETAAKYGRYCFSIAKHVLANKEDAEEAVNDTYLCAWERIPPHKPSPLSTFLGKITRRISLNKYRDKNREKRGGGEVPLVLEELSECVASGERPENTVLQRELSRSINAFLSTLGKQERDVFVSRYWFLFSVREICERFGFGESKTKSMLSRTREKLKRYLLEEGLM